VSALSIVAILLGVAVLGFIGWMWFQAMGKEAEAGRPMTVQFGLGLALLSLFVVSWVAHGLVQWEVFQEEQRTHEEPATASGFVAEFMQSTFENWQSEFLQLLAMVVLTTVLIYTGSSESRDSQDRIEQKLDQLLATSGAATGASPPNRSATKPEWVDYAVSRGTTRDDAEAMTKEDRIHRFGE
jgi:amino acid transporter